MSRVTDTIQYDCRQRTASCEAGCVNLEEWSGPPGPQEGCEVGAGPGQPGRVWCGGRGVRTVEVIRKEPMDFAVRCHLSPPSALLAVRGDLDVFSAAEVGYRVGEAVRSGCLSVMLDAGETPFVDIAALSELARAAAMVRAHDGSFDLAAASPSFRRLSTLSGLDVVFRLVASPATLSRTPGA